MNNVITQFNEGFFKEAAELQMDTNFLKGLVAENDEAVQKWAAAFDEIEQKTGDRLFRYKLAGELAELMKDRPQTELMKQANGMMEQIMQFAQNNPEMAGGGIGGLLGLLLGIGTNHPLMGLLLGGLGGAGLGHFGKSQKWWGGGQPTPDPTVAAGQARDDAAQQAYNNQEQLNAGQLTPEQQQEAAMDAYNNQEFENIGQQPQPPAPAQTPSRGTMIAGQPVRPQNTPVVPPPQPAQQQQRGAPMGGPQAAQRPQPQQYGLAPAGNNPVVPPPRPGVMPRQNGLAR